LTLGLASSALGAGGPTLRRGAKDGELQINLPEGAIGENREGRNLANVFPFVGGERGIDYSLINKIMKLQ